MIKSKEKKEIFIEISSNSLDTSSLDLSNIPNQDDDEEQWV